MSGVGRASSLSRLAGSALARLLFLAVVLLGAPVATRAVEARFGYVRWHRGSGAGLEHVGASRPPEVLLHLRNLGSPSFAGPDVKLACAAGDVDRDGHGDLWVLSALGPGKGVGGGIASLVSGRTRRVLRRMRQYDLRAANLSIENTGDLDGDAVDDLLLGQILSGHTRLYWVRSGASGRLLFDVQRVRRNMLGPVYVEPIAGGRTRLAVARTPRDFPTPLEVDHVDPRTGAPLGEAELPPIPPHLSVEDLGDLDGDGWAEHGGWAGSELVMDRLELVWAEGAVTKLVREVPDGARMRIDTAGDLDADGVPDVLVEASFAQGPAGRWSGELWVLSGASLVDR